MTLSSSPEEISFISAAVSEERRNKFHSIFRRLLPRHFIILLFLIPAYFAFHLQRPLYLITSVITALVSINPEVSRTRMGTDRRPVVAKVFFLIYFCYWLSHVRDPETLLIAVPGIHIVLLPR
jgi:hypothetical protein